MLRHHAQVRVKVKAMTTTKGMTRTRPRSSRPVQTEEIKQRQGDDDHEKREPHSPGRQKYRDKDDVNKAKIEIAPQQSNAKHLTLASCSQSRRVQESMQLSSRGKAYGMAIRKRQLTKTSRTRQPRSGASVRTQKLNPFVERTSSRNAVNFQQEGCERAGQKYEQAVRDEGHAAVAQSAEMSRAETWGFFCCRAVFFQFFRIQTHVDASCALSALLLFKVGLSQIFHQVIIADLLQWSATKPHRRT